jgi:hypothetical protein
MENETPDLVTLEAASRFNLDRTEYQTDGTQKAFVTILPGSDATLDSILRQARTIHTKGTDKLKSAEGVTVVTLDDVVDEVVTYALLNASKGWQWGNPISNMDFKDGVLTVEPVKPIVDLNASNNSKVSSLEFTFEPGWDFLKGEHH